MLVSQTTLHPKPQSQNQVVVLPTPNATITSRFPVEGSSAEPHSVGVSIAHLAPSASLSDFNATVLLPSGQVLQAGATALARLHGPECTGRHCTRHVLSLLLPPLPAADRDSGTP